MISNKNLQNTEDFNEEIEADEPISVDDFIKELEAKEKDLHISSDLVIEIGDSDFAETGITEFAHVKLPVQNETAPAADFFSPVFPNSKTFSELEDEISRLKTQLAKMEIERDEIYESSRRRQRDFENYKNRTERERQETFASQINNLATQILPVLDNLNRALDFANDAADEKAKEFQQFFHGIYLVNQQLNEVLSGMGVSLIASVGEPFDPHYHEAVAIEETGNFPPNTISTELLRGYRIGNRVIRPSMVKVAAAVQPRESAVVEENETENTDEIIFETE
ncbi:MAG: grpE [Acidobacteria bacterium]|jgi:molecular chaperone GrpE|nr:grpE [Acidobacteriota bacterium]